MYKKLKFFIKRIIKPISLDEDSRRQEYILNIILLSAIMLVFFALIRMFAVIYLFRSSYSGENLLFIQVTLLAFFALYFISRLGYRRFSASSLLFILYAGAAYTSYRWGADIPQALLIYGIIIIMSGILISSKFAILTTIFLSGTIILLAYLQSHGYQKPNYNWMQNTVPQVGDAIIFSLSFMVIAIISWLSNKEIEKNLNRARRSEEALKRQKDELEIMVEERTKELKETQLERINQLDKFAEFGRVSSGVLHDLVNPLTVVSLNLEKIFSQSKDHGKVEILGLRDTLSKAMNATKKMENFIAAAKKHIQKNGNKKEYDLTDEIRQVMEILAYKARKMNVELQLMESESLITYGDPISVNQVVSNLISNSIDAYEAIDKDRENRKVMVFAYRNNDTIFIYIKDWGCGIGEEAANHIFQPFYSTKPMDKGIGIGLSNCKSIVESRLNGRIYFKSTPGEGATFYLEFPIQKDEKK